MEEKKVIIYTSSDGQTQIDVRLEDETLWLTQQQIAELFQTSRTNVVEHIKHIYEEKELEENSTCRNFRQVRTEGTRQVERELPFYNLDMIISLGYRIKSRIATHFRQWATQRLKEYMIKGFTLDDDRLKKLGGGGYWKELLERIRDIRATEKVFYRQVLEIYATSIDYDPRASVYLDEKELRAMGQLVSGYLDFAERQAEREQPMTMNDWANYLDRILTMSGEQLLQDSGSVSHARAMEHATNEYRKYKQRTISDVEQDYLDSIKILDNLKKKGKSE